MYQMDIHPRMNDDPRVYICKDDFYVSIYDKYNKIIRHKRHIIIYFRLTLSVNESVDLNADTIYLSSKKQSRLI